MKTFAKLIRDSYPMLDQFAADRYPDCFQDFERASEPIFHILLAQEDMNLEQAARELVDALDSQRQETPKRKQKTLVDQDKRVLTLFLSPAAGRYSERAKEFALILNRVWVDRHPESPYVVGTYEKIMEGFQASFLGIPLKGFQRR